MLFQLHIRNAVHQQSTDSIGPFEDGDFMPHAVQLSGRSQSGRSRSDDCDPFARSRLWWIRLDPALFKPVIDDRAFDILDRDGRVCDSQHARTFTRGGTNPTGEFGEIVRLMQTIECFVPMSAIDQIVPFWNQIIHGTASRHSGH